MQITARSDRDLTPESIVQKVSDASGAKYTGGDTASISSGLPPALSSKPAFMPTRSTGGAGSFNPLTNSGSRSTVSRDRTVDEDGWGQDAPPVTRTQLEKVQSSYQPTKVNMRELSSQKQEPSRFNGIHNDPKDERSDVVKGGYQPVGKVDIAALRKQAQQSNSIADDKPSVTKGAYEPVGKVDIAAIRARAQQPSGAPTSPPSNISPAVTGTSMKSSDRDEPRSVSDRYPTSERLTSLPKPKVANRFGSNSSNFTGTKAPAPSEYGFGSKLSPSGPPVGVGRTFADEGGKTPAQIWADKKARERGMSSASEKSPGLGGPTSPIPSQTSGGGEWKSGYTGKSWGQVQTTKTGQSVTSMGQQRTGQDEEHNKEPLQSPVGGISAIRDRFSNAPTIGVAPKGSERSAPSPPPLDTFNKPNASRGVPMPGLPMRPTEQVQQTPSMPSPPPQPPRSPTPPTPPAMDSGSPIRVAMPVARGHEPEVEDARDEQFAPPPAMPIRSLAQAIPHEDDLPQEEAGSDPSRHASITMAANSFGTEAAEAAHPGADHSGKRALVQYDYEKAEDNELELKEGEYVTNIEMVDEDWWMGQNPHGETGLFPSNYVELVEDDAPVTKQYEQPMMHEPVSESAPPAGPVSTEHESASQRAVATALYDYEAAEDNELSFPEGAKITGVVGSDISFVYVPLVWRIIDTCI